MELMDILFCDDIRIEINNKVSLMGLYNDRIVFRVQDETIIEWPVKMDLAILVRLRISEKEKHPVNFVFECVSNEKLIAKIDGNTNLASSNSSVFILILNAKNIDLYGGDLGYSIKIYDNNCEYLSEVNNTALRVE